MVDRPFCYSRSPEHWALGVMVILKSNRDELGSYEKALQSIIQSSSLASQDETVRTIIRVLLSSVEEVHKGEDLPIVDLARKML